jgi:hypothetical protein
LPSGGFERQFGQPGFLGGGKKLAKCGLYLFNFNRAQAEACGYKEKSETGH